MRLPNQSGNLGRYDDQCEKVLEEVHAQAVVLLVFSGDKGSGFSVATTDTRILAALPDLLTSVASDIATQNRATRGN